MTRYKGTAIGARPSHRSRHVLFFVTALAAPLLAPSCSQHVKAVAPEIAAERFNFLRDGDTTQREILDRLGQPSHSFERDHVVVYVVHEDHYGSLKVGPGNANDRLYHLVIMFADDGAVGHHRLIRIR